ncbi:MAG TPA: putative glycoside hydrolase, partial [Cellvibrio sp.]|nr:putative glycoside hydrolase [Cellvibrio sp.]
GDIKFYVGRPLQPWNVFFNNPERNQILSGAYAALPDGSVVLRTSDKDVQEDALTLTWKNTWSAGLTLEGGKPLDLREYVKNGVLSLDINVIELAKGGVNFRLQCGEECKRKVPFTEQAFAMAGKGWQNIRLPLSCFAQDGDDFSAVTLPFALETGGAGELAIANVQFLKDGKPNATCPDYKTVAVTPSMLNEFWARDWWEPRHKEKLQRIQQGNVDLLMIGDSITQGWENEGKTVWQEYYADRNAVNLGYGGDRTENVLWRLQHGEVDGINPKVAVLMIGTNNTGHRLAQPKYTATGIKTVLQELRTRLPDTKILLLGIFPREEKPDAEMRQINNRINDIIKTYADNQHIFYLNINDHFLADDGTLSRSVMPDLLHLNESSYATWAKAIEPTLVKLLQE